MTKGGVRVPGIEDVEEFTHTQNAMKVMGISDEDMASIWRVISACLLFGNMEFKQERNSDQATLPDNTVAQKVHTPLLILILRWSGFGFWLYIMMVKLWMFWCSPDLCRWRTCWASK